MAMNHIPLAEHGHDGRTHNKDTKRRGDWLPAHAHLEGWLVELVKEAEEDVGKFVKGEKKLSPAIHKFYEVINTNPVLWMHFQEMITQPVVGKPYNNPSSPFRSVEELVVAMDLAVRKGPHYDDTVLVGCPLNAVFDYCMATPAGYAAFRDPIVNKLIKDILTEWCKYLSSAESCKVLNHSKTGWLSEHARKKMNFHEFKHDPNAPHYGFTSWNNFFTRHFVEGARPVVNPQDNKEIISSCESTPYCIQHNVKLRDKFWIKHQPYSLVDMLLGDELAKQFVGGSIYQAFLSALNYHRWHSPVNGTVVKIQHMEGTYYSEAESEGFHSSGIDHSEGYLTAVAARAAIYIQADDPVVGLMCVLYVGMGEVSSNIFLDHIKPSYKVKKGEEIGYFQFGGSTHCLIFRPGAIKKFEVEAPRESVVFLNSHIATAN